MKKGVRVLLVNGKNGTIQSVNIKKLDKPETTYNFEVKDYHTYYVGQEGILVHNTCSDISDEIKVIGRLDDTAQYKGMSGFDVLDVPNWTLARNDAWVQSGINNNQKFLVASEITPKNLISSNPLYPGPTVFARELDMLNKVGYIRSGNYLIPPK